MEQDKNPTPVKFSSPGKIILAVIVTAVVVGGGVFVWQTINANKEKKSLRQEIVQLKNDLAKADSENAKLTSEKRKTESDLEALNQEKEKLAQSKLELEKAACTGIWKEAKDEKTKAYCLMPNCQDSDATEKDDAYYVKGTVSYIDMEGSEQTLTDECNDNTLMELSCFDEPKGDERFSYNMEEIKCRKGCKDGACIK